MPKDTFYFSHDYDPTGDPKIQAMIGEYGAAGYGLFWRIVEMLHAEENHQLPKKEYLFLAIAKQMLTNAEQVVKFIEDCTNRFELFISDGDHFWSNRVYQNIDKKNSISVKRSMAGKEGAIAKQVQAIAKQNEAKERKEKENRRKKKEEIVGDPQRVFYESLVNYVSTYGADMVRSFYDYWSEYDIKKIKMRWQMEKTWEVQKRLATWSRRDKGKGGGLFPLSANNRIPPKETPPSNGKNLQSIGITT